MRDSGKFTRQDSAGSVAAQAHFGLGMTLAVLLLCSEIGYGAETVDLQASYVLNLSKFVDWPVAANSSASGQFKLCIQGEEVLGKMTNTLNGQNIGNRPIDVVPLSRQPGGNGCDALFIKSSELWRLNTILADIRNRPVLTISDGGPFARNGGMIELMPENGRLVFEINQSAIERAGLKISSKVLALAKSVYR